MEIGSCFLLGAGKDLKLLSDIKEVMNLQGWCLQGLPQWLLGLWACSQAFAEEPCVLLAQSSVEAEVLKLAESELLSHHKYRMICLKLKSKCKCFLVQCVEHELWSQQVPSVRGVRGSSMIKTENGPFISQDVQQL